MRPATSGETSFAVTKTIASSSSASPSATRPMTTSERPCPNRPSATRSRSPKRCPNASTCPKSSWACWASPDSRVRSATGTSRKPCSTHSKACSSTSRWARPIQPPAWAIWPRLRSPNANQNAHRTARSNSPRSSSWRWARSTWTGPARPVLPAARRVPIAPGRRSRALRPHPPYGTGCTPLASFHARTPRALDRGRRSLPVHPHQHGTPLVDNDLPSRSRGRAIGGERRRRRSRGQSGKPRRVSPLPFAPSSSPPPRTLVRWGARARGVVARTSSGSRPRCRRTSDVSTSTAPER